VATVLVQPASEYPAETWRRLAHRQPVCLVTEISGSAPAVTRMFTPENVRDAVQRPGADGVARMFATGTSATAVHNSDETTTVLVTLWPATSLLVVGDGAIAAALASAAALLEWNVAVINDVDTAVSAAGAMSESDAVVVLSHDRDVDGPTLQAALSGRVGYIGAMGSRGTQAARRDWLNAHGVTDDVQSRVHGPAGLDIDAHTPGEIAISITAEILANRSGTGGGPISDRGGPVHNAGVHAPPPRY
jgi:xanthine dehydrogenase accessory factor